jgi:hypothetical protein
MTRAARALTCRAASRTAPWPPPSAVRIANDFAPAGASTDGITRPELSAAVSLIRKEHLSQLSDG